MAELSMASSCCSNSLRCSWNTTSKSPSSPSGCICQRGGSGVRMGLW